MKIYKTKIIPFTNQDPMPLKNQKKFQKEKVDIKRYKLKKILIHLL